MVKVRKSRGADERKWNERLKQLTAYKIKHGNCDVPKRFDANPQLGKWAINQRYLHKKGELSDDRVERLEKLGITWDRREDSWEEHFKELKAYKRKNGDCNVPARYPSNPRLGKWVDHQRQAFKIGKLSDDRVEILKGIEFNWGITLVGWDERFKELKAYWRKHGNCDVPFSYDVNPPLGRWVGHQRTYYNKGFLLDDRKELLEEIGFNCGTTYVVVSWEERFKQLKAYRRENGNCNATKRYSSNPSLGHWVSYQRQLYKRGQLSDDCVELLEGLGFQWIIKPGFRESGITEGFEDEELVESKDGSESRDYDDRRPAVAIGEVGYVFYKQFDDGWYNGEVVKIRPGAAKGKDRRCRYSDGDEEDLSIHELRTLAKLDRRAKKKTIGAVAACASTASRRGNKTNGCKRPDFHNSPKKVIASGVYLGRTKTPRQLLCPKACDKSLHDRRDQS